MVNLKNFFEPKRIAVIGASRESGKVGHVIFKNILDGGFEGEVIPVNPNADMILSTKAYSSVIKIKDKVDLAIISVPAKFVLQAVKECKTKGIRDVLIITAGFGEIGNHELEQELKDYLNKNGMRCIGVNCLGIFNPYNKFDSLFLPRYKLKRPEKGSISFVSQSGAVGSSIMDIATNEGHKFAKFISYGNGTQIDESDLIEYLGNDKETKVICLYVEGIKNGEKFFRTAKKVSKKKPIIALKGGLTQEGMKATLSHTGSLAGQKEVYFGVFNQTGVITATSIKEMLDIASLFEKDVVFKGNKVQIITNGGGFGILSTDALIQSGNLKMTTFSDEVAKSLRKRLPENVNIGNPLDLVGDATNNRYQIALEECIKDKNIDGIVLIALHQTPLITTDLVEIISEARRESKNPIVVISTGGEFTETLSESLENIGMATFSFPDEAVKAISKLVWYYEKRKGL